MSLQVEFGAIMQELTKFQNAMGRAQQGLKNPEEREMVGELLTRIEKARADAETAVPNALTKIREVVESVQQRAEEQSKKLAELQKQIEERKKNPPKAPTPPPKPEVKFDPMLGAMLSKELIAHVTPPVVSSEEPQRQVIKEVWEDWNWDSHERN